MRLVPFSDSDGRAAEAMLCRAPTGCECQEFELHAANPRGHIGLRRRSRRQFCWRCPAGGVPHGRRVVRELNEQDRTIRSLKQAKGVHEHAPLERGVLRFPERAAQREGNPESAWRLGLLHVRTHKADNDSRNAPGFDHVGERAHGARAERSNRAQENGVDGLLFETAYHRLDRLPIVDGSVEPITE